MLKLTESTSFKGEPTVTIISFSKESKGLEKSAADSRIGDYLKTLVPKEGKCYLHINAMGAGEWYGSNRNGDYFPEENLKAYYQTFSTSPAHLFRHHINKDPARANGVVIMSIYNERMHRVELIVEADKSLVADVESRILRGDYPSTSMACKTPYDICSICGNKAHTRQEYCSHLRNELGKLYTDGRKVMALNLGPLKFFDISIVIRPADVTSSILQKVAGEGNSIICSLEVAENEGLVEREKRAEFKKLSELIKNITDGVVMGSHDGDILSRTHDLPLSLAKDLSVFDINEVLTAFSELGINPSLSFLSELIGIKHLGQAWEGIGPVTEAYLHELGEDKEVPVSSFEKTSSVNPFITRALIPYVEGSSLLPAYIEKRASGVGYFGLGPYIEPTPEEEARYAEQQRAMNVGEGISPQKVEGFISKYGKLLLQLGGAALVAKWFIANEINNKMKQQEQSSNRVKIVIVKKASDYSIPSRLGVGDIIKLAEYLSVGISPEPKNDSTKDNSGFFIFRISKKVANRLLRRSNSEVARKAANVLSLAGTASRVL